MNTCVFCSAQDVAPVYVQSAERFAQLVAENKHALIWGGSDRGLMKAIATGVQKGGGTIIGISMELLKHKARKDADEMIVTKDLSARKALMLERSDAFVALVGGIGTLDELTEVLALKRHGQHAKPIVLLNTDGFYEGLKIQFEKMNKEGFLENAEKPNSAGTLVYFADSPEDAMRYINEHGN